MGAVPSFAPTVRKSVDANGNRIWVNDVIPDFGDGTYGQIFTDQQLKDAENQRLANIDKATGLTAEEKASMREMSKTMYAKEGFDPSWTAGLPVGGGGEVQRQIYEGGWITGNVNEADWSQMGYNPYKEQSKSTTAQDARTAANAGGKRRRAATRGLALLTTNGNTGGTTGR